MVAKSPIRKSGLRLQLRGWLTLDGPGRPARAWPGDARKGTDPLKILAAAIQMPSAPLRVAENVDRADALLHDARRSGVSLAVLPEMFNTGYARVPCFGAVAEGRDGPTVRHLLARSRTWGMAIAFGFVEADGGHLYDSVGFATPNGELAVYRKRNLVFWERSRFYPGRDPLVVETPWGRVGFAVCADMIYRRVWDRYRGRIDLAVIAAAWPDFADRESGRKDWLLGHVGPMAASIPGRVAHDLGIPVVFSNQVGETETFVPILRTRISDRFAGQSSVSDGRHGPSVVAGCDEAVVLAPITIHPTPGPRTWRSTSPSAPVASSSGLGRS